MTRVAEKRKVCTFEEIVDELVREMLEEAKLDAISSHPALPEQSPKDSGRRRTLYKDFGMRNDDSWEQDRLYEIYERTVEFASDMDTDENEVLMVAVKKKGQVVEEAVTSTQDTETEKRGRSRGRNVENIRFYYYYSNNRIIICLIYIPSTRP